MKPQVQRYRRSTIRPGDVGDCHRTCVAMILNMHRDDVPHFMADCHPSMAPDDPAMVAAEQAEVRWLSKRGLTPVNMGFPGDTLIVDLLEHSKVLAHGAPMVLGCTVNAYTPSMVGYDHSVVICDGKVYNPNPGTTITGPMRDGNWWLTIYSVGPGWRSPLWRDRMHALRRQTLAILGVRAYGNSKEQG